MPPDPRARSTRGSTRGRALAVTTNEDRGGAFLVRSNDFSRSEKRPRALSTRVSTRGGALAGTYELPATARRGPTIGGCGARPAARSLRPPASRQVGAPTPLRRSAWTTVRTALPASATIVPPQADKCVRPHSFIAPPGRQSGRAHRRGFGPHLRASARGCGVTTSPVAAPAVGEGRVASSQRRLFYGGAGRTRPMRHRRSDAPRGSGPGPARV